MTSRWVVAIFLVLLVVSIYATFRMIRNKGDGIEAISAFAPRLTGEQDKGENLTEIPRNQDSWIYYRVILKDAPLGEKITLDCEWTDPSGQIVKRNHYETLTITHDNWQTHCRDRFGPASPAGTWTVTMSAHRRVISKTSFVVKANN